ncbi:hypothetical protein niasHT_015347 [Heterodera trifolii]|uniref:BHLH domain-containing protein n=1 Tax=Heterodera trifolii TaxID=157864 RepID=A0ABD2KZM4_9BILA
MADIKQRLTTIRAPGETANRERDEAEKNSGGSAGKRNIAQLAAEKIEPYVRKRRCSGSSSERSRKRTEHLNEEEQNILRLHINSRERKRMHDMNDSLDELRKVLPFAENDERSGAKKMSKIETILLAKMCILGLTKEIAELRANNERLTREMMALKRNGQTQQKETEQSAASVTGTASTSSQRNAPQTDGLCRKVAAIANVGLLPVPPCRISSADPNSVLSPPFVPFSTPMLSTNAAAFLMQEKSNQILGNAFAVHQLLSMKSANDFRQANGAIDLFGHLSAANFPVNNQMENSYENEQPNKATTPNRKRRPNGGRKEDKKKGVDGRDSRKSIGGTDQRKSIDGTDQRKSIGGTDQQVKNNQNNRQAQ